MQVFQVKIRYLRLEKDRHAVQSCGDTLHAADTAVDMQVDLSVTFGHFSRLCRFINGVFRERQSGKAETAPCDDLKFFTVFSGKLKTADAAAGPS